MSSNLSSQTGHEASRKLPAMLGLIGSALPFFAVLMMIAGFCLAAQPLVTKGLPIFLDQSALTIHPPMTALPHQA